MVSNFEKATALTRLKLGDSPIQISADLGLPTMLVKEWQENLDMNDLVIQQANTNAISRLVKATPSGDKDTIAILRAKIEETAIEIMDQVSLSIMYADPVRAKALQLLANTCSTLYTTLINKDKAPITGDTNISLFQQLSKD